MDSQKKQIFRKSFKAYLDAGKEVNDCKDPCIKNGRSDRYCLECANAMMFPIIENFKNSK